MSSSSIQSAIVTMISVSVNGIIGFSWNDVYNLLVSDIMCSQNFSTQSDPLYWVVGFSTFLYANLECKHYPDGVCTFTPLAEDWLGLLLAP